MLHLNLFRLVGRLIPVWSGFVDAQVIPLSGLDLFPNVFIGDCDFLFPSGDSFGTWLIVPA
jgi:hypothetical protein